MGNSEEILKMQKIRYANAKIVKGRKVYVIICLLCYV